MKAKPTPTDLTRWLEKVTRGFPTGVKGRIWEEIEDHYFNAMYGYQTSGKSETDAHRLALAELGSAGETRHQFYDVYLAKWRYLLAGFLSMSFPLLFVLLMIIPEPDYMVGDGPFRATWIGVISLAEILTVILPIFFIAYVGIALLAYRFHFHMGKWRIGLFVIAVLAMWLPSCIDYVQLMMTNSSPYMETYQPGVFSGRQILSLSSMILLGLSIVLLSIRTRALKSSLYGMRPVLQGISLICGVSQVLYFAFRLAQLDNMLSNIVGDIALFSAVPFMICLGWLLIKAAFHGQVPYRRQFRSRLLTEGNHQRRI